MVDAVLTQGRLDALDHAILFSARRRRRSLAGIVDLFRTHRLFDALGGTLPLAPIDTDVIFTGVRNSPITFSTAIRFATSGLAPAGLVFEFGGNLRMTAIWIEKNGIGFRSGGAAVGEFASEVFDNGTQWPAGLELEIVGAIRPGTGQIGLWLNGERVIDTAAASGNFNGEWCGTGDGAFASAAVGNLPVDVTQSGAPANFAVIEPLSVYTRQVPRQFVSATA